MDIDKQMHEEKEHLTRWLKQKMYAFFGLQKIDRKEHSYE